MAAPDELGGRSVTPSHQPSRGLVADSAAASPTLAGAAAARATPAPPQPGACVWFTGLSGSGKTTTAQRVQQLLEEAGRVVTMLDGDVVRTHLSAGLGFSRQDRDVNVTRVGYVASEIVRHGGIVLCSLVSPYRETRDEVRRKIGEAFIEVFVDTPVDVCAARDVKGLYAAQRRGEVTALTGVEDPYEPPAAPELHLETVGRTVEENARTVLRLLTDRGVIRGHDSSTGSEASANR